MDSDKLAAIDLAKEPSFRIGNLVIVPSTRTISVFGGIEHSIEPKPLQMLILLSQKRNSTVGRKEMLERCWNGRSVSNDAIERVVAKLRRLESVLAPGSFQISTVARVGYRLDVVDIPRASSADAASEKRGLSRRSVLAALGLGGFTLSAIGFWQWRAASHRPLRVSIAQRSGFSINGAAGKATEALSREIGELLARVEGIELIDVQSSAQNTDGDIAIATYVDIAGGRARLGAELRVVGSDGSDFTAKHEAALADIFAAQRDVAALVLQQVVGLVTVENVSAAYSPPRRDIVAFRTSAEASSLIDRSRDAFMQGQDARGADLADQALALVRQALTIDESDPEVLVALAKLVKYGSPREFAALPLTADQRELKAETFIRKALLRDPNNPKVLTALADHYRRYQWRWQESENLLRRALAKDSSLVEAHWSYGYLLGIVGRSLEGLAEVRRMLALDSSSPWRRLAMPRLLDACGQRAAAKALYERELDRNPANLFVLREIGITLFITRNLEGLRQLASRIERDCGEHDCEEIRAFADRTRAAADALSGQKDAFTRILAQEVSAFDAGDTGGSALRQGRASVDLLYLFAIEFAWIGQHDAALSFLERALAARSVYWPTTLPYGIAQFPKAMRRSPRYAALWDANPHLGDLVTRRLRGLRDQQMAGVLPDGTTIRSVG